MGRLNASVEGLTVSVEAEDVEEMSPRLRAALAELADAMVEDHASANEEVAGFGLGIGSLGLSAMPSSTLGAKDCWGFSTDGGPSCTWYSHGPDDSPPDSCTIYSVKGGFRG